MSRQTILEEIEVERKYQEGKWGNDTDDKLNDFNDWVSYISHHSTRWFNGGFPPYQSEVKTEFRKQMVKVAALAVAAIESFDRKETKNG